MTRHTAFPARMSPPQHMLHAAVVGAASEAPSQAPKWLATALLDTYGDHAVDVVDSLPRMIRDEARARHGVRNVEACRTVRPDHADLHDTLTARPVALADLSRPPDPPMWRAVAVALLLVCALTVVAMLAAAGAATISGTAAQIERGAVEW